MALDILPETYAAAVREAVRHVANDLCCIRELASLLIEQADSNESMRIEALGVAIYALAERVDGTLEKHAEGSATTAQA